MNPLGLPLAAGAAVITGCLATTTIDGAIGPATIQAIDSYCSVSWRRANIPRQDWDDCTQQVFVRLLTRLSCERLAEAIENTRSHHRRELNRCIWATTQWWRRSHAHRLRSAGDGPDPADRAQVSGVTLPDVQEAMRSGVASLTAMQRSVIELWASGYSITDMACRLGVPSRRICDEKYRALSKLRARFTTC